MFWTGFSSLEDGWLYKSRADFKRKTGLGNRDQDKARGILRGEKPYGGRTARVLEERHPKETSPTEYRVLLEELARELGIEVPGGGP